MIVASSADVGSPKLSCSWLRIYSLCAQVCGRRPQPGWPGTWRLQAGPGHRQVGGGFLSRRQGAGDLGDSVTTAEGTVLYRSDTVKERPLRTISRTSHADVCFPRARSAKSKLRPIDARINRRGQSFLFTAEFSQMFCVEKAFHVGARQVETVLRQSFPWTFSKTSIGPWASRPMSTSNICRRRHGPRKVPCWWPRPMAKACPWCRKMRSSCRPSTRKNGRQSPHGHAGLRLHGGSLRAHSRTDRGRPVRDRRCHNLRTVPNRAASDTGPVLPSLLRLGWKQFPVPT